MALKVPRAPTKGGKTFVFGVESETGVFGRRNPAASLARLSYTFICFVIAPIFSVCMLN